MKNVARSLALIVGVGLVLTAVGCRKCVRPEEPIPPPPLPETMPEIIGDIGDPGAGSGLQLATIYFDFDMSVIRPGDARKLEENARQLNEAAAVGQEPMVSVEGHCDPMGTAAYNMALGMRRAEAAKAFLVKLGVPAARFSTVSFGKEKLATSDPDEFELNRRVEFKVQ
ncbi:MAG TPA: peptidoglycan-associated lipoprotein [candidate division WOR-3 bacterium]|uniref:Peptidoglycan-associated lipoprotein n=1 Tax=candidate division WOR-3 bacterium TaxID=2052148 RepID=A0A7V0XEW3_UNCW3|nr:peptidoglycan-associated lipoprotein [candidate division WOR-3 bacterium]